MRVALLGDSHAEGLNWVLEEELQKSGHDLVHVDHNRGWSTKQMLDAGKFTRALRSAPDVLLVSSGGNDGQTDAVLQQTYETAFQQLAEADVKVLWTIAPGTPVPWVESRRRNAARLLRQHAKGRVEFFDARTVVHSSDLSDDEIHLTRSGYKRWAAGLRARLDSLNLPVATPALFVVTSLGVLGYLAYLVVTK